MAIFIVAAIVGFVYWRLHKTNMTLDNRVERYADNPNTIYQVVHYIQPRTGKPL